MGYTIILQNIEMNYNPQKRNCINEQEMANNTTDYIHGTHTISLRSLIAAFTGTRVKRGSIMSERHLQDFRVVDAVYGPPLHECLPPTYAHRLPLELQRRVAR